MLPHVFTILQPLTPCCRGWPWEWLCKAAWTMWSHAGAYVALPGSTSMLEQVIEMYWHRWVVRLMGALTEPICLFRGHSPTAFSRFPGLIPSKSCWMELKKPSIFENTSLQAPRKPWDLYYWFWSPSPWVERRSLRILVLHWFGFMTDFNGFWICSR